MRYTFLQAISVFRLNNHLGRSIKYCNRNCLYSLSRGGGATKNSASTSNLLPQNSNNTALTSTTIVQNKRNHSAMTEDSNIINGIWKISDEDNGASFSSLNHIGYSMQSDSIHHTGGWLAHRLALEPSKHENGSADLAMDNSSVEASGMTDNYPPCWIRDEVANKLTTFNYSEMQIGRAPRILVLYGSLRPTSFSKKLAYEYARLLETLGCDVRVYNPQGLPVRDPALESCVKVQELRSLTLWSDGHVWVSPEMHGQITGTFKNQIDWIPLNTGSVRPTQGLTCCVAQVNGGSQSFNAVNTLRLLARWMRMPCCTNQSSVAKAWQEFDDNGRMKESSFRDRVVDCAEEFAKFTAVMTPVSDDLVNRYSERKEKEKEGRLLTQAEKETKKTITESRKG